ncbi:MAG: 50S ribosome-binding GTPase [Saprospiraceae bacterium]|nr:50S ribosome-binding GTPase [Saprospiraceae bacterium]
MLKLALIGNPNSGKSSVFNALTGLHQKVGNYPGVTVEVHSGVIKGLHHEPIEIIDFPGAYSLHSNTSDEFLLTQALLDEKASFQPDAILYIADIQLLDKQLLLLTQIIDLKIPVLVCLSNCDQVDQKTIDVHKRFMEQKLLCKTIPVSTKTALNLELLKTEIKNLRAFIENASAKEIFFKLSPELLEEFEQSKDQQAPYHFYLWKHYAQRIDEFTSQQTFDKKITEPPN